MNMITFLNILFTWAPVFSEIQCTYNELFLLVKSLLWASELAITFIRVSRDYALSICTEHKASSMMPHWYNDNTLHLSGGLQY